MNKIVTILVAAMFYLVPATYSQTSFMMSPSTINGNQGDTVTLTTQAQAPHGGTLTYQWQQTGGTPVYITNSSSQTTDFVAPALAGDLTFTVTATDPVSGKSATQTQKFTVRAPAINAQKGAKHIVYNNHGPVKLNARVSGGTAPFTYVWTQIKGPSTSLTSNTDASPSVTPPSVPVETLFEWEVTITDANGCTAVDSVNIIEPALLDANVTGTDMSCGGSCDGTATSTPLGGTAPYTYAWSTGSTNNSLTGLCMGTYDVTVTDANGCEKTIATTLISLDTEVPTITVPGTLKIEVEFTQAVFLPVGIGD